MATLERRFLTPALDPSCERCLALARWSSRNQTFDGDVLVELGPVNPLAAADESPFRTLVVRAMSEPRIPRQRHGNRAAVAQVDGQSVVRYHDVRCRGNGDLNQ